MNRAQLVAHVARETRQSRALVDQVLAASLDAVVAEVAAGGSVSLVGFAKFAAADRPERQGRNPATGESITIPAARTVRVTVSKGFKDAAAGRS